MSDTNGWDTYSKLVLQQLETLSGGIEALRQELQQVQSQLTELKAKEDRVQDLKAWKDKMDDVASPPAVKNRNARNRRFEAIQNKSSNYFCCNSVWNGYSAFYIKFYVM